MSTTNIVAIVVCFLVTLGIAVPLMINAWLDWRRQAALWRALATKYGVVQYLPPAAPLDTAALSRAFDRAVEAIVSFGPWERGRVLGCVTSVRIELNTVDEWTTLDGQHVAGQSLPENGLIRIGPKFGSLCHEICHCLEWMIDRKVDYEHATWGARGLFNAQESYLAGLGQ